MCTFECVLWYNVPLQHPTVLLIHCARVPPSSPDPMAHTGPFKHQHSQSQGLQFAPFAWVAPFTTVVARAASTLPSDQCLKQHHQQLFNRAERAQAAL